MLKILSYQFKSIKIAQPILEHSFKNNIRQKYKACGISNNLLLYSKTNNGLFKKCVLGYNCLCRNLTVKSAPGPNILDQNETDDLEAEPPSGGKLFTEYESMFHHKNLEDSNVYSNTLFKQDCNFVNRYRLSQEDFKVLCTKDWRNESPYHVATAFISFGIYSDSNLKVSVDNEQFNNLVTAFIDSCSKFSDEQLIDCMIAVQIWPPSNHIKENNYLKIWKTIDNVCLERYMDWSVDKTIYMMDLWYQMKLIRLSGFVYKGLKKLSRRCKDLTRAQMIQIMFYMSCTRKLHPMISMREYEYYLQKHITHMTIDEIGIFNLAFFKTRTSILNQKLLMYTMQRTVEEINTIHEVTLTAITKALRFSHKPDLAFTINDFVQKVTEQRMSSLKLVSCIHIAHITTKLQFYNEQVLTQLAEKFMENPADARLKDMERVAFILSLFNHIPLTTPDVLKVIVQQLDLPQHVAAGEDYGRMFLSLVYFLTLMRVFPEKQIKHILSEEFIKKNFDSKYMIAVQLLQIDYNRVLEGPQNSEHLLPASLREYLSRKNSIFLPNEKYGKFNNFDQMMMEVIDTTKEVLGEENYLVTYTLPHFPRADIIFRLDSKGQPMPIPEELRAQKPFEDVVRPVGDGWRCAVVASRNMYMYNIPRLVGEANAKLRQIRLLGYTPILIPYQFWNTEKNKTDYLKLKYFNNPE